jgi:hypothetical protein
VTKSDAMMEKLTAMEATLTQIVTLLEALLAPAPASTPEPPVPIATYEQMYGPIEAASVEEAPREPLPGPERPSRLRRWFVREEQA